MSYDYSASGALEAIGRSSGELLWEARAYDVAGRLTEQRSGDGTITTRDYDPLRGFLGGVDVRNGPDDVTPDVSLQTLRFDPTPDGSVESRRDLLRGHAETFGYDALDRLRTVALDGAAPGVEYDYDAAGNLTFKTGVGAYVYDDERPQVLASAGGAVYQYDELGRQTHRPGNVVVTYGTFDLPLRITQGGTEVARFTYGVSR